MRELQVIGLDAGGKNVLLRDKGTDDRYSVPADDRLRAAARGDLSRLGQIEVEADSSLRPREIQARIRLGASVSEVAAEAGIGESRVERYAHPVLLERSNIADLGRKAHPVRADGPAEQTLDEIVTTVFRARGLDADEAEWDAWRNKDAEWIVQLAWQAGRSDNAAHWRLYKEGLGGTLTALDDSAADLIDPDMRRPLRPLISVGPADGARPAEETRMGVHGPQPLPADGEEGGASGSDTAAAGAAAHADAAPQPTPAVGEVSDRPRNAGEPSGVRAATTKPASGPAHPLAGSAHPASGPDRSPSGTAHGADTSKDADRAPGDSAASGSAQAPHTAEADTKGSATVHDDGAGDADTPQDALIPDPDPHRAHPKTRKNKPSMPSWEDVLLGVRSNNG